MIRYQFEFRFTDAEIKRFYAHFARRYYCRTNSSLWNLYWISNLVLCLVLAIKSGDALWFLLPPLILYLAAYFISHRQFVTHGAQAIARSSMQPWRISIGKDWVLITGPTWRTWTSAKEITGFQRIDQYYVLFARTKWFFPIRIVPEEVRSGFEATLSGMVNRPARPGD